MMFVAQYRNIALVISAVFLICGDAQAWSRLHHKSICMIAEYDLKENKPVIWNKVEALLKGNPWGINSFQDICFFADELVTFSDDRFTPSMKQLAADRGYLQDNRMEEWHYIALPYGVEEVTGEHCGKGDRCLLGMIDQHFSQLKNAKEHWQRQDAMVFLAHWIGDLHQPLHVAFARDRNGRDIYRNWFLNDEDRKVMAEFHKARAEGEALDIKLPDCATIHDIWDKCIVYIPDPSMKPEWNRWIKLLKTYATTYTYGEQDRRGSPLDWANSSLEITRQDSKYYSRFHDSALLELWYQDKYGNTTEIQDRGFVLGYKQFSGSYGIQNLMKAGLRLSMLLEQALSGAE